MMRASFLEENPQEHMGTAELARLLEECRQPSANAWDLANAHPHLAVCSACRAQFEELAIVDRQLAGMAPAPSRRRQADCPLPSVWRNLAGGVTPPEKTLAYVEHASRCDHCGPLLRAAVSELAGLNAELSEAESEQIASLASASAVWQQSLAKRITGAHSATDRKPASWWRQGVPRLAIAGAFLLALVGAGWWFVTHWDPVQRYRAYRNQPATARRLLARAYTAQRTLELRFAGAAYAPLRISRGPAASFAEQSPALLKAQAMIAAQMQSHPADPAWLQAQAQADLLGGAYDAAVESLRRALELEPHSPALLIDLATAYFQRARQQDRKEDFGAAYEYLSQALKFQPDDPVALFNRAIVSEYLFLYQGALDDWEDYLRVDPGSQWAQEARDKANAVREKLKEHQSQATPLLSLTEVAALASGATFAFEVDSRINDPHINDPYIVDPHIAPNINAPNIHIIDQRIEEYLIEAVRSWLPQAFPETGAEGTVNADAGARRALFLLADLTSRQHGDRWLADLLAGSSSPNFPRAVNALAGAVRANLAGDYGVFFEQAKLAEELFRASGNAAGGLRAQFDQAFAEQMTRHGEACRRQASAALMQSEKFSYPWLQVQLGLEEGVCSGLMSDLGHNEIAVRRAMDRARKSGYEVVYLRALGFLAGVQSETGNVPEGWRLVSTGLNRYWSGQFPAVRGYNLYTEMAHMAEVAARPHLQMASWREGAARIDSGENLLIRAMAHQSMADAATAAGVFQVAEQQYAEAARLFAAAPPSEASRNFALWTEIKTAQLEADLGRFDNAIVRLTRIQDQIRRLSNNYDVQFFYSTLGELQLGRNHAVEAEQALRPALALAEQSLTTLTSEAKRRNWTTDAAPAYLALVEAELMQGRSQGALETYEWYLGAPLRAATDSPPHRSLPNAPQADTSPLASRLPLLAKQTVLAYAALPDGLAIWVYDDRGINARWIPKPTVDLQEVTERFHDLAADPKSELSALRRDARSLYQFLIAPIETQLAPGRTLVIEAAGWLALVPFEALLDSNDHYLIERAPIVHSLGQDSQARLRKNIGISADLPALVVGSTASSSADGLIPLPDVAGEADAVASDFRSARVLKGKDAALGAVRTQLHGAAVFHFAGHSLATPESTGLLLDNSPEGGSEDKSSNAPRVTMIDANFVRRLHPQNLRLAVLSACSTASGNGGSGGFDSVTDAFLRAGVPHVVASRWAVDSVETQKFVQNFYRSALSGQNVSEAVRRSSRNMLANPRTSHPYYWSAFAAYGRP
jgi:CHAT domain-containing protein